MSKEEITIAVWPKKRYFGHLNMKCNSLVKKRYAKSKMRIFIFTESHHLWYFEGNKRVDHTFASVLLEEEKVREAKIKGNDFFLMIIYKLCLVKIKSNLRGGCIELGREE